MTFLSERSSKKKLIVKEFIKFVLGLKGIWRTLLCVYLFYRYFHQTSVCLLILSAINTFFRCIVSTAGCHRYFSHKSYKCHPIIAHIWAIGSLSNELGETIYWCLLHGKHHQECDGVKDLHSPMKLGFWSVQLRTFDDSFMSEVLSLVNDPQKMKRLKDKFDIDMRPYCDVQLNAAVILIESVIWVMLGYYFQYTYPLELWFWMNCLPRTYVFHGISLLNSACHLYGDRPYTGNNRPPYGECMATNIPIVAVFNLGDGWHNNHHAFSRSARCGLLWWEVDVTWYVLCMLAQVGLVWDIIVVDDVLRSHPRYQPLPVTSTRYKTIFKR